MRIAAVESTTLSAIAYDETEELLVLQFYSRVVYQYNGVPAAVHEALLEAPSKGRYFNEVIRGRFPYRLVAVLEREASAGENCSGRKGGA